MDVETFFDTSCIKRLGVTPYEEGACAEGIDKFLDILNKHGIKATLFVTTDSLKYTAPYLKKAQSQGHILAFHATNHVAPINLTLEEFEEQIRQGVETMQSTFGGTPSGYRAPCFMLDDER
jgi:peptidoglycan/xylan/chitin deacetylase (PgdA/CDA1 family)